MSTAQLRHLVLLGLVLFGLGARWSVLVGQTKNTKPDPEGTPVYTPSASGKSPFDSHRVLKRLFPDSLPADKVAARVDSLINEGEYSLAEAGVQRGLDAYPTDSTLALLKSAIPIARQETSRTNQSASALRGRIDALIMLGQIKEAQKIVNQALQRYPDDKTLREGLTIIQYVWLAQYVLGIGILLALSILAITAILVWVAFSRGKGSLFAAQIYVIGSCIAAIPAAFTILYLLFPFANLGTAEAGLVATVGQLATIAGTCILGAIGGTLANCFSLVNSLSYNGASDSPRTQGRDLHFAEVLFKPFVGFFMAAVMYIALMAGHLVLFGEGDRDMPPPWTIALLAVLTGMFANAALARLQSIADHMFGEDDHSRVLPSQNGKGRSDTKRKVQGATLTTATAGTSSAGIEHRTAVPANGET
ncbi:MAG: tetratricopeptide repeat protein [Gemmatimonadota bacterium]